jgi:hypothetical protein
MKDNNKQNGVVVRSYTLDQLADLYEVNWRVFRRWIKPFREEIGQIRGRVLTIPQVKIIYEKLDYPPCFQLQDDAK